MPAQKSKTLGAVYVNTIDATPTSAATFATRPDKAYQVTAKITAINTADTDEAVAYWLQALFANQGGTLAQIGSTQSVVTALEHADLAGATANLAASGTNIVATLTGVAATTLTWQVDFEVKEVGQWVANAGLTS